MAPSAVASSPSSWPSSPCCASGSCGGRPALGCGLSRNSTAGRTGVASEDQATQLKLHTVRATPAYARLLCLELDPCLGLPRLVCTPEAGLGISLSEEESAWGSAGSCRQGRAGRAGQQAGRHMQASIICITTGQLNPTWRAHMLACPVQSASRHTTATVIQQGSVPAGAPLSGF